MPGLVPGIHVFRLKAQQGVDGRHKAGHDGNDSQVQSQNRQNAVDLLTAKQAKAEYARLTAEIAQHDKRYYQEDRPSITDAEYDELRKRYNAIEERFPDLRTLESLSLKVGAAPSGKFKKVRHALPMLSLDNAFADEDVVDFVARIRRFLKLDETRRSPSAPSRRSTACRCRCATRAANW